jgi:hypothetical protein
MEQALPEGLFTNRHFIPSCLRRLAIAPSFFPRPPCRITQKPYYHYCLRRSGARAALNKACAQYLKPWISLVIIWVECLWEFLEGALQEPSQSAEAMLLMKSLAEKIKFPLAIDAPHPSGPISASEAPSPTTQSAATVRKDFL